MTQYASSPDLEERPALQTFLAWDSLVESIMRGDVPRLPGDDRNEELQSGPMISWMRLELGA